MPKHPLLVPHHHDHHQHPPPPRPINPPPIPNQRRVYHIHPIHPHKPNPFENGVVREPVIIPLGSDRPSSKPRTIEQPTDLDQTRSRRQIHIQQGNRHEPQHYHHPPPPLIPLSAYAQPSPTLLKPSPTQFQSTTTTKNDDGAWFAFEYRGDRVNTLVYRGLTPTKRKIIKSAYPLLAGTKESEIGLYLVVGGPAQGPTTTSVTSSICPTTSASSNPPHSETILLDHSRWQTLLLYCKETRYFPLIYIITLRDLGEEDGRRIKGGGKVGMTSARTTTTTRTRTTTKSTSSTPIECVQPPKPLLTIHPMPVTRSKPPINFQSDHPPNEMYQPTEGDWYTTKEEAIGALKELVGLFEGDEVGAAGVPASFDLDDGSGMMVVDVDCLKEDVGEAMDCSSEVRSLSQSDMMVETVEVVVDTDNGVPLETISAQEPTMETVGRSDPLIPDLVSGEFPPLSPKMSDEGKQIEGVLRPKTALHGSPNAIRSSSYVNKAADMAISLDGAEEDSTNAIAASMERWVHSDIDPQTPAVSTDDAIVGSKQSHTILECDNDEQPSLIPTETNPAPNKDNRNRKRVKKAVITKPSTTLPIIDRVNHHSARGMTKNERRLHESLRAKFDGRGIAS